MFGLQWTDICADKAPPAIAGYHEDSGWYVAYFEPSESTIEKLRTNTLALEIGEFAYQLRAALDGLMWDAITLHSGAEPPTNANRVEFPILNGRNSNFQDCGFHKYPFPDHLRDWLESIQPNAAEKPLDHPDYGLGNTLAALHDLARFDRHRALRLIVAPVQEVRARIILDPPPNISSYEIDETFDFSAINTYSSASRAPPLMALL